MQSRVGRLAWIAMFICCGCAPRTYLMDPVDPWDNLEDLATWDGWKKQVSKFGEQGDVEAIRDGNRRLRNMLELEQEMYMLACQQYEPDFPGFGLESADVVQLLGTPQDAGRTFTFIVTDREVTDNADGSPPTIEDWTKNLSIRVLPIGAKARISPLVYHSHPLQNELERIDARLREYEAQLGNLKTLEAVGVPPSYEMDAQKAKLEEDKKAVAAFDAADDLIVETMTALIKETQKLAASETAVKSSNALLKKLLTGETIEKVQEWMADERKDFRNLNGLGLLKRTWTSLPDEDVPTVSDSANTGDDVPTVSDSANRGSEDKLDALKGELTAAVKEFIDLEEETGADYWTRRSGVVSSRTRYRGLQDRFLRAKAELEAAPDAMKRIVKHITVLRERRTVIDDALTSQGVGDESQRWHERRSFLVSVDAADLNGIREMKIILERPEELVVPPTCSDMLGIRKLPARRVYRIPVYRGICRTKIVLLPEEEVRRRFGRLFSETFITARVDVSNPGAAPIEVYASTMWVKVRMMAERSNFIPKKAYDDVKDEYGENVTEKKKTKWYEARRHNGIASLFKGKDRHRDDYATEWRIFYTKFRPYTFRDVLAMFEASRRRSWQQTTVNLLRYAGTLGAGAGIFTTDIDYLEGVNFFNGIFRPATEELLMRELMARLSDLERSSFHDIEPIAANAREDRLVFFPKQFIANIAGVIVDAEWERDGLFWRKVVRPMPAKARILEIKPTWLYVGGRRILQSDAVESEQR